MPGSVAAVCNRQANPLIPKLEIQSQAGFLNHGGTEETENTENLCPAPFYSGFIKTVAIRTGVFCRKRTQRSQKALGWIFIL
jgi:hypothetical protein